MKSKNNFPRHVPPQVSVYTLPGWKVHKPNTQPIFPLIFPHTIVLVRARVVSEANTLLYSHWHFCLYIYSVTKILRIIYATNFTENYGKLHVMGDEHLGMSEHRFQLVFVALPFTRSLPARIQWLTRHKLLRLFFIAYTKQTSKTFFETAIGDFSC